MNLVIDDAVEVRLPTKTEEGKRRPLGACFACVYFLYVYRELTSGSRANIAQGR
jgi:hypothetical protein